MRGSDTQNGTFFSYVSLEDRIPVGHPLRKVRAIVNDALRDLDAEFSVLYALDGRPSIPPERLVRAALIQILFSVRSERQLMEQMQYNLLFRWFVGLGIDDPVWVPTVFSKNRDRLLNTDIAKKLLAAVLAHHRVAPLLSDEHFSVDGTLVEAWASMKSLKPKEPDGPPPPPPQGSGRSEPSQTAQATDQTTDEPEMSKTRDNDSAEAAEGRNAHVDFRGQKRSNATHRSASDPAARLYRKGDGKPAQLCFMGHALMENRSGFVVEAMLTQADGYAERVAALAMIDRHAPDDRRLTLGADKGYDCAEFVEDLRERRVTPHIAAKAKGSAIDGRTTRHAGYAVSQKKRKQIEESFGWGKTVGHLRKTMYRGIARVGAQFVMTMTASNLARLPRLLAA